MIDDLFKTAIDAAKTGGDRSHAAQLTIELRKLQQSDRRKAAVLAATQGEPLGVELELREGLYALISQEPDDSGRARLTFFDPRGFSGHCLYSTAKKALDDAFLCGYSRQVIGVLDRLSQTALWQRGIAFNELCARHNRGEITFQEFLHERDALPMAA